jgi:hypothetical protein
MANGIRRCKAEKSMRELRANLHFVTALHQSPSITRTSHHYHNQSATAVLFVVVLAIAV